MSSMRNKPFFITALAYFGLCAFSLLVMAVYYAVDHGLRDIRMTLLFLPCLLAGIFFLLLSFAAKPRPNWWSLLFHMGFAALYLYLLLAAIIAMADCENVHLFLFWVISIVLFAVALFVAIVEAIHHRKEANPR